MNVWWQNWITCMDLVLFHPLISLQGSESLLLLLNRSQVLHLNTGSTSAPSSGCSDPLPRGALIDPNNSLPLLLTTSLDMQWAPYKGLRAFPVPEGAVPGSEHPEKQNLCFERSFCDLVECEGINTMRRTFGKGEMRAGGKLCVKKADLMRFVQ